MHEWALAEAVVETAIRIAKKEKMSKITVINIKMGELQQIDEEIFKFALEEIIKTTPYAIDLPNIMVDKEPAMLKCNVCNNLWTFSEAIKEIGDTEAEAIHFFPEVAHVYVKCPKCNSPDFEISAGRGVWISSIEGE